MGGRVPAGCSRPLRGWDTTLLSPLEARRGRQRSPTKGTRASPLDLATSCVGERRPCGKTVSQFQGVQFMLADMAMKLEAAAPSDLRRCGHVRIRRQGQTFFSAAAKCFASDTAMQVTFDAVQLLGATGHA